MKKVVKSANKHQEIVYKTLEQAKAPLSAYDVMDKLRGKGVKAPPTVYRALESLIKEGRVHRIESLNAFVACGHHHEHHVHPANFAVCQDCGDVTEIEDKKLDSLLEELSKKLKFSVERRTVELIGHCKNCKAS